jgi:uncharacterized protein YjbI with pentapeptide repeats
MRGLERYLKNYQKKTVHNKKPQLDDNLDEPKDLLRLLEEHQDTGDDIYHLRIKDAVLENHFFSSLEFNGVLFEHCMFTSVALKHSTFDNVLFRDCDFTNCNFSDSWFTCCEFTTVKNIGADFRNSKLFDMTIDNSNFRYSNFSASGINTCAILGSDMSDTFFAECVFKSVVLDASKFIRTDFFKTPLKSLDFSTCDLQAICISDEYKELKGVVVNTFQAVDLSRFLGIVIKDD